MKYLVILAVLLSGCSSFNLRDNLSDVAATTAGVACGTVNPGLGVACGTAAGLAVNNVTQPEEIDISQVENEFQAEVAKEKVMYDFFLHFAEWIIGGIVVLIIAAWLIPGPQSLFRRKHAKTDSTSGGAGPSGSS